MCRVNRWHTRKHRVSTTVLLGRTGLCTIDAYVSRRQLRWAGHVARMHFDRLPRKMLSAWVTEKRPVGAPEFTYGRGLYKTLKKAEIDTENWFVEAQDREGWRDMIAKVLWRTTLFLSALRSDPEAHVPWANPQCKGWCNYYYYEFSTNKVATPDHDIHTCQISIPTAKHVLRYTDF